MIDKSVIKDNFSRYARIYDRYCLVQDGCAKELINKVKAKGFMNILDIGCGTGNYTALLSHRFPKANLKAVDISSKMVDVAKTKLKGKTVEFIVADGEDLEYKFREEFDLITSNASFQWFENLGKAISQYKRHLVKEGRVLFSIFGPGTFYELNRSLKEAWGGSPEITAGNFIDKLSIEKILKKIFSRVRVKEKVYRYNYASLLELLETIKYTGARGYGIRGKSFWTKKNLVKLETVYKKQASSGQKIRATYQVFFCEGSR